MSIACLSRSTKVSPASSTTTRRSQLLVGTWIEAPDMKRRGSPERTDMDGQGLELTTPSESETSRKGGAYAVVVTNRNASTELAERPSGASEALLQKIVLHPTSSRQLSGLKDVLLMALAFVPTLILRLVRQAMGLLGITEHRWRGVSMVEPLRLEDKQQVHALCKALVAGTLGRRPEPPALGPVPPGQQLLLDAHSVLAAASATAAAFNLLYEGFPEAQLQAKMATHLRSVAAADSICTQDCLKYLRKTARRVLESLCTSAPLRANTSASGANGLAAAAAGSASSASLASAGSGPALLKSPSKRAVAKAFMYACLMQQARSLPERLVLPVAELPAPSSAPTSPSARRASGSGGGFPPSAAAAGSNGDDQNGLLGGDASPGVLAEAISVIPLGPGIEYLRLLGDKYAEQVEYMLEFGRLRPSDAKREVEVQGMAINARLHEIGILKRAANGATVGGGDPGPKGEASSNTPAAGREDHGPSFEPVYGCPRSGAFAVHGREPRGVGLSGLVLAYASCHGLPLPHQQALLQSLGYKDPEQLRAEIETRKALCVAQALPVVVASLQQMCRSAACIDAAYRTGSFLHAQQSLLSDTHRHERAYLEDTKGALDMLSEKLSIRFVPGSSKVLPLNLSGNSITLSLSAACIPDEALAAAGCSREGFCSQSYSLLTAVFNQGINGLQSLGLLMRPPGELLQDTLNRQALERLNDYAARSGRAGGPALAALNFHYSPAGHRDPKDVAQFALVRGACKEIGAGRAVNCKSGKDRTALELSKAMAAEAIAAGLLSDSRRVWLEQRLQRGLSYVTTSHNHGQPPAYAFNEMEIVSLPAGWRPDWRLCGKVSS